VSVATRAELPADVAAVHAVEEAAFGRSAEAELVDRLRATARPHVSLVAARGGDIVGHIFFSPVHIATAPPALQPMGLAPMAVRPDWQRRGVGGALVRAGLDACCVLGSRAVVVLGHPEYYARFGFVPAVRWGLGCEYDASTDAFMAIELAPGALAGITGMVRYASEFAAL